MGGPYYSPSEIIPLKKFKQENPDSLSSFKFYGIQIPTNINSFKDMCNQHARLRMQLGYKESSLLMFCCGLGFIDHVSYLIETKPHSQTKKEHLKYVKSEDNDGHDALSYAIRYEQFEIVNYLLSHGFKVKLRHINHGLQDERKDRQQSLRMMIYLLENTRKDLIKDITISCARAEGFSDNYQFYLHKCDQYGHPQWILASSSEAMRNIMRNYRTFLGRDRRGLAISLLIARELCPDSPFYKAYLPLDIFKIIFRDECWLFFIEKFNPLLLIGQ